MVDREEFETKIWSMKSELAKKVAKELGVPVIEIGKEISITEKTQKEIGDIVRTEAMNSMNYDWVKCCLWCHHWDGGDLEWNECAILREMVKDLETKVWCDMEYVDLETVSTGVCDFFEKR